MATGGWAECAIIAGVLSLAMFGSRMRAPLGADEGYLWFGIQQMLRGRMPHRDFKSYEPGRYLWSALLARMFGKGLLAVRISTHVFFAMGLLAGLIVLRESGLGWPSLVLAGIVLALWSHPQHKQFEHGWVLIAWAAQAHMLMLPSDSTLALAAATTGLALFFGFNLFLYFSGALLFELLIAIRAGWLVPDLRMAAVLVGAGLLGMLPFALMLSSAGFARNFFRRRIGSVLSRGASNLPLPRPWPWRPVPGQLKFLNGLHQGAFQGIFLGLFVLPPFALAMMIAAPGSFGASAPAIVAAAALGILTCHHAASRADVPHIAQVAGPFWLLAILLTKFAAPAGVAVIAAFSLWAVWPLQASAQCRTRPASFCRHVVGGIGLDLPLEQAQLFDSAADLCRGKSDRPAGFFAAPAYPALYASLFRDSPVYDTFCLYPADDDAQQAMIGAIERARVFAALVSNAPIDGRDELRFSRTHPRVWAHLCGNFHCSRVGAPGADTFVFIAVAETLPTAMPMAEHPASGEPALTLHT